MTMVPRTGPLSASSALATTSWYHRGKSVACGVRIGAFAMTADPTRRSKLPGRPGEAVGREHGVSPLQCTGLVLGDTTGASQGRERHATQVGGAEVARRQGDVGIAGRRRARATCEQPAARVP